jgi:hypothetical protein
LPSTTGQSSLKVLSRWVLLERRSMISFTFPQNPSVRSWLAPVPGNWVPWDCGSPWWRHSSCMFHCTLSWVTDISGMPAISLLRSGLTMEIGAS